MLALVQKPQHPLRMSLLRSLSTRSNDLQVRLVLTHERDRETGKSASQQNQRDSHAQVHVEVRVAGVLGQLFVTAMAPRLQQRRGARERQEQQLRQTEHGRPQGYRRAVSIPPQRRRTGQAGRPADGPV